MTDTQTTDGPFEATVAVDADGIREWRGVIERELD